MIMLPLLQASTPNTVSYMLLGYAIIGGIGLVYVVSLVIRQRNLQRDVEVVKRLIEDE